jgi:hypothetical protein
MFRRRRLRPIQEQADVADEVYQWAVERAQSVHSVEGREVAVELLDYATERGAKLSHLQMVSGRLLSKMPRRAVAYFMVEDAIKRL